MQWYIWVNAWHEKSSAAHRASAAAAMVGLSGEQAILVNHSSTGFIAAPVK